MAMLSICFVYVENRRSIFCGSRSAQKFHYIERKAGRTEEGIRLDSFVFVMKLGQWRECELRDVAMKEKKEKRPLIDKR